ncbi:MAG: molybdopterin molybdotransferase MoeA [Alteraurantiacibacter sp.]|nr:molybdopterin molybdotransferase MoeA [Alteraurantiacibacter sp.]
MAGDLLDWQMAQEHLLALAPAPKVERVATSASAGRILAQPLKACRSQPAADLSAMDGYAVCADDTTGPWQIVGESAAGHPFAGILSSGQAVRISTGAVMPEGAGAVLLQENAQRSGDRLVALSGNRAEVRHVRRAGFDFGAGDLLLGSGVPITPAGLALALMGGHGEVDVFCRPSLAVIDSGDELAGNPASALPHQIPCSNGPMLAAMAMPYVSRLERIGPVTDRMDHLLTAFDKASAYDVIVTTGGASVGDHDLVQPALEKWGATIDFWRIALKPGKPLMVARRGEKVILGLPGNPVSSFVTGWLFLLPLLRKMGGDASPLPKPVMRCLEQAVPATQNRAEFLRGLVRKDQVLPLAEQDSSALRALSRANALICRPPGAPALSAGSQVPVFLLRNGGIA